MQMAGAAGAKALWKKGISAVVGAGGRLVGLGKQEQLIVHSDQTGLVSQAKSLGKLRRV